MSTCERGTSTRRGRAAAVAPALVALLTLALASLALPAGADTAEVSMAGTAFTPETVTVQLSEGEPEQPAAHAHVNFVNRDEGVEHTVSFDDRSVAVGSSGRLVTGQIYTVIFEEPGMFLYRCEIHPNMAGTVAVTAPRASEREEGEEDGGSGTSIGLLIAVAAVAAATGAAAVLLVRRRRTPEPEKPGRRPTRSGGS